MNVYPARVICVLRVTDKPLPFQIEFSPYIRVTICPSPISWPNFPQDVRRGLRWAEGAKWQILSGSSVRQRKRPRTCTLWFLLRDFAVRTPVVEGSGADVKLRSTVDNPHDDVAPAWHYGELHALQSNVSMSVHSSDY